MADENEKTMSLSCPHCNGTLKIPPSLSGQVVDCPHCAKQLTAPGTPPEQNKQPPAQPPNRLLPPESIPTRQPATSPQKPQNRPPQTGSMITLEGPTTPNLPLNPGESVLLDIAQGFRDLGLAGLILRHKGRLIVTTQRAIAFKKKTKDFDIQQLNMRHAGFISLSHRLNFIPFLLGIMLILGSIAGMGAAAEIGGGGAAVMCLIMLIAGIIVIFTAKAQSLVLSGSGAIIIFRTKSVSADVLAKALTAVSANS